jgi:neutral ceramidase
MQNEQLLAGTARIDISPPVGIAHAGWGAQRHQVAEAIDMPLYITALILAKGDLRVAIVDIDVLILTAEMDAEARAAVVKETGIQADNIRLAYSHNHGGPAMMSRWITEGTDLADTWYGALPSKIGEAAKAASVDLQPVVVSSGAGECRINVNRRPIDSTGTRFTGRNWNDPVDREVGVVGIDKLDGTPLATMMVYACHPTIMGHDSKSITPDFPGPARRRREPGAY